MATILGSSNGEGNRYTLTGETVIVPDYALINSTDADGINSSSGYNFVWALGTIAGLSNAIQLGDDTSDAVNRIVVADTGFLAGIFAVRIYGHLSAVTNLGTISGTDTGVYFVGAVGQSQTLENHGIIHGAMSGVMLDSLGSFRLINTGIISGAQSIQLGTGNDTVINRGTLIGDALLGGGNDNISNYATLTGSLYLGSGNDLLDNKAGQITGTIFGGDGNDTFFLNPNEIEIIDGGDGIDTISFVYGGAVTVALDGSIGNAGQALGDVYGAVENIIGSLRDDIIIGNMLNNALTGADGNDVLNGREGNDVLRGGTGRDTLTGGLGNDLFRYHSIDEAGDVITDFSNIAGNNDAFQFSAAGFGGGLVAGALAASAFQAGTTNVASNANIRFVYRTTDNTVWFDADGNGGGAAVLIATLQAGAMINAADFLIF